MSGADRDWDSSLLRRVLIALILLKLIGLIVLFDWTGQFGFDLPKALWSRALEWPMAGAVALAVYRYGSAVIPRSRFHFLALGIVLANLVSALAAENPYTALYGEKNRYLGLTNVIDMAVLYVAVVVALRLLRDWSLLAAGLAGAVLAAVAYGVIQYWGFDPISWSADPRIRPFGTIGNPDMYGHLLAVAAAACVAVAAVANGRSARLGATGIGLACIATLAFIGTRGSILALTATLCLGSAIAFGPRARVLLSRRIALLSLAVALVAVGAFAFTPTGHRLLAGPTTIDRMMIWSGSWAAFVERPILGWGPDSLAAAFPSVRPPGMEAVFSQGELLNDEAHDWILQTLATTGVVGLASLVALTLGSVVVLYRARRGDLRVAAWPLALAATAYWTNALTSPDSVSIGWIPWVIFAGSAWIASPAPITIPPRRRLPTVLAAGTFGLTLSLAATGWNAYRANEAIATAIRAYPSSAELTLAGANEAISRDPGRGDYYNYRGLGFQLRGLFPQAAADFEQATKRVPYQAAYWINLSRSRLFQAQTGDERGGGPAAALALAKRAVQVDPWIHAPHRNYAEVALALGDPILAFEEARIAFSMYQLDPQTDVVLGAAATLIPDHELARRGLEAALTHKRSAVLSSALARVYLTDGNLAAARAAALEALLLEPGNRQAQDVLAAASGP